MDHKIYPKHIWANSTIFASMTKKEEKNRKKKKQAKKKKKKEEKNNNMEQGEKNLYRTKKKLKKIT